MQVYRLTDFTDTDSTSFRTINHLFIFKSINPALLTAYVFFAVFIKGWYAVNVGESVSQ